MLQPGTCHAGVLRTFADGSGGTDLQRGLVADHVRDQCTPDPDTGIQADGLIAPGIAQCTRVINQHRRGRLVGLFGGVDVPGR